MSIDFTLPSHAETWKIVEQIRNDTKESIQKGSVIIRLDGQRIKTTSGKSIWPSVGAAKNAWNNHIYHVVYRINDQQERIIGQELECDIRSRDIRKEITQYMINQHILEFVKVGDPDVEHKDT